MKENKDLIRKQLFDSIIENHINGNLSDCKELLKNLSKLDLIRFVNYLHLYIGYLYIDINGNGELDLFNSR